MLYVLGFKNLSILDGSFNEWKKNNLPTESKINIFEKSEFKIEINNKIGPHRIQSQKYCLESQIQIISRYTMIVGLRSVNCTL